MTRPEGSGEGQQPAAAVEAPDHTGDQAMANAESAAVDVDERTRTSLTVLSPRHPNPVPLNDGLPAMANGG